MRRLFPLLLCLLFLCGCQPQQQDRYKDGYDAGFADGYKLAMEELNSRTVPTDAPAPTPRPTPTPKPTAKPTPAPTQASDDFTVYVSSSGTMHKKENCSGMKHSTPMPYSVASQYYEKKCSKCFK